MIGRRDFMKSTLAGFGGVYFLTLNETKQEEKPFDIKGKEKKRVYRTPWENRVEAPGDQHGGHELRQPQSHPHRVGFLHPASGHRPRLHAGSERGGDRKRDQGTPQGFLLHQQQGEPAPGSRGLPWTSRGAVRRLFTVSGEMSQRFRCQGKNQGHRPIREIPAEYIV